jgi:hypothetical protein
VPGPCCRACRLCCPAPTPCAPATSAAALRPPNCSHLLSHTAAAGEFTYTSLKTGDQYLLSTIKRTADEAEARCNRFGGHLATWSLLAEQQDSEHYFIKSGFLIPAFHMHYYIGYRSFNFPRFAAVDKTFKSNYTHWGANMPNRTQTCAHAHVNLQYQSAWGWEDVPCNVPMVFMCKTVSEWRWPAPAACPPASLPLVHQHHRPSTPLRPA